MLANGPWRNAGPAVLSRRDSRRGERVGRSGLQQPLSGALMMGVSVRADGLFRRAAGGPLLNTNRVTSVASASHDRIGSASHAASRGAALSVLRSLHRRPGRGPFRPLPSTDQSSCSICRDADTVPGLDDLPRHHPGASAILPGCLPPRPSRTPLFAFAFPATRASRFASVGSRKA